jgi:hypothetical protein
VPIEATHESRCGACGKMIYEGDPIEQCEGEWVHEQCALDEGC